METDEPSIHADRILSSADPEATPDGKRTLNLVTVRRAWISAGVEDFCRDSVHQHIYRCHHRSPRCGIWRAECNHSSRAETECVDGYNLTGFRGLGRGYRSGIACMFNRRTCD